MALIDDLLASRAELVSARANGMQRVVFTSGGTRREVEYKSDADMAAAIAALDREIAQLRGRRVHTFKPYFNKGF